MEECPGGNPANFVEITVKMRLIIKSGFLCKAGQAVAGLHQADSGVDPGEPRKCFDTHAKMKAEQPVQMALAVMFQPGKLLHRKQAICMYQPVCGRYNRIREWMQKQAVQKEPVQLFDQFLRR